MQFAPPDLRRLMKSNAHPGKPDRRNGCVAAIANKSSPIDLRWGGGALERSASVTEGLSRHMPLRQSPLTRQVCFGLPPEGRNCAGGTVLQTPPPHRKSMGEDNAFR